MRRNNLLRYFSTLLLTAMLVLAGTVSASADDTPALSDARWSNGSYSSSLGDMAGRRLYVCGMVDSDGENAEPDADDEIELNPYMPISRLDAAMLLYRVCGTEEESACPFIDVPEEFLPAVAWLYATGITNGVSEDQYGTDNLTRAQFLTMLSRLLTWDSDVNGKPWEETLYEQELTSLAQEKELLSLGVSRDGLTRGDVYLILLSLMEQYYPEKLFPVRSEISLPDQISLYAYSFDDAAEKVEAALQYAPNKIELYFSPECSEAEISAVYEKYKTEREDYDGAYPFTATLNTARNKAYTCTWWDAHLIIFRFYSYAPAYLAWVDSADWLRCFEDKRYSDRIQEFMNRDIRPLLSECGDDYTKAWKAQDLICRIASYDWAEYASINSGGSSAHPEAHSITGFLNGGAIVCDGYAKTYQWILRCLGVDSFVVYGIGAGDNHAWNKVQIDGNWYNADVCWKDTGSGDYYFLRSDSFFRQNQHSFSDDYVTERFASPENYYR